MQISHRDPELLLVSHRRHGRLFVLRQRPLRVRTSSRNLAVRMASIPPVPESGGYHAVATLSTETSLGFAQYRLRHRENLFGILIFLFLVFCDSMTLW